MKIRKKGEPKKEKDRRYIKVKRKKGFSYYLSAVALSAAILACFCGVVIVDRNSRLVGWNQQRTEFAFSSTSDKADITVMGKKINLSTVPLQDAAAVYDRIGNVYRYISPCPLRLTIMAVQKTKPRLRVYRQILQGAAERIHAPS